MKQRIISISFPRLATDRCLRRRPVEGAFVLTHLAANAQRIYCLNETAERMGLCKGMSFADARAISPDLLSDLADPLGDRQFLEVLARWADRYCPLVALDQQDGLLLDITGAAHLFGGEEAMLEDLMGRLERAGVEARAGLAGTIGAAWAIARFAPDRHKDYGARQSGRIVPDDCRRALSALPAAALRIAHETAGSLRRVGLSTIGDLCALPRATLARRFGQELLGQLDRALGQAMEPLTPMRAAPVFCAGLSLAEPVGLADDVLGLANKLLLQVCSQLEDAQRGARRVRLTVQRVDGSRQNVTVGLARPIREASRILRLFAPAVDKMDAGFGIERLSLEVVEHEACALTQTSHLDRKARDDDALADLISRIGNRIGFSRIQRYLPAESHIPEKSFIVAAAAYSQPAERWLVAANRPLVFFHPEPVVGTGAVPPQRFRWRNMNFEVSHSEGPERIQPEWWLEDPEWHSGLRDYWRVVTAQGRRLWLFHTPQVAATHLATWFVHGEFA